MSQKKKLMKFKHSTLKWIFHRRKKNIILSSKWCNIYFDEWFNFYVYVMKDNRVLIHLCIAGFQSSDGQIIRSFSLEFFWGQALVYYSHANPAITALKGPALNLNMNENWTN